MSRKKTKRLTEAVPSIWQIYAYFWPSIRQQRWLIMGSLLSMVVAVGAQLLEPWPLKWVLDGVRHGNSLASHPAAVLVEPGIIATPTIGNGSPPLSTSIPNVTLLLLAVATIAISLCRAYADYFSNVGFFTIGNRVVIYIRDRVYTHLQRMSLAFHNRARSGDLIIRVTRDVSMLRDVTSTAVLPLVANVLVLVGMVSIMFILQWKLALLSCITAPLFWMTTVRISKRIREAARKQRQREGAMATTASEALAGIAVVQALSLEKKFADDFAIRNRKSQKEDLKASRLSVRLSRSVDVLLAGAIAVVLFAGGRMVFQGTMSPGSLFLFVVYLKRSFKPAQQFAKYAARIAKAAAAGERIVELLKQSPEVRDLPTAREAPLHLGTVQFDHVSFSYEDDNIVLQDITLECLEGKVTALVGASGSGKTTMLSLLLRLYDPISGTIRVAGEDIRELKLDSLRRQMSVVLQDCLLFHGTIRENIALGAICQDTSGSEGQIDERLIEEAARLAGAHDFITRFPLQYATHIGEGGVTLSRGQRQRIAIARAAMRDSSLLLLDEPTTGLDEKNERIVMAALLRLAIGKTTLLVTHNLSLAARADQIIYLEHGRVMARGTHEELLHSACDYAALFQLQSNRSTTLTQESTSAVN